MKKIKTIIAFMTMMVLVECDYAKLPNIQFTLYISNQSLAIDPVDIQVELDGIRVVSDNFYIGSAHTFVPFELSLDKGMHKIDIWTVRGDAELSTEFKLNDQDAGIIMYWYYPNSHYNPTPPKFDFITQKGPPAII